MKKILKITSRITNIICQLILIVGVFYFIKQHQLPMPVDFGYKSDMMESAPAPAGSAPRMMAKSSSAPTFFNDAQAADVKPQAKIIKTGRMGLEVQDIQETKKAIYEMLTPFKAYVLSEDEGKGPESWYANMSIKIPAQHFDALVEKISAHGFNIESKSVNISDVTEQYIDLEARLKNKRLLIQKYTALLSQSQKIADTIEINRQLESVSSELESLEGQMKYLNHQIDLSTLDLNIVKRLVPTEKNKSFFDDLKYELSAGINGLRATILFIFGLWPFILIGVAGYFIYRKYRK